MLSPTKNVMNETVYGQDRDINVMVGGRLKGHMPIIHPTVITPISDVNIRHNTEREQTTDPAHQYSIHNCNATSDLYQQGASHRISDLNNVVIPVITLCHPSHQPRHSTDSTQNGQLPGDSR
jgi:hypothetical protein